MKLCKSCDTEKARYKFGVRAMSVDGLSAKCNECASKYDKARANDPHRVKARADYAKTEAGKAAHSRGARAWIERNAIKKGASTMVGNAVRDGKLIKPETCEACGSIPSRLHGHHDDYAKPLDVRWLCPGCHSKWHQENGRGANAE